MNKMSKRLAWGEETTQTAPSHVNSIMVAMAISTIFALYTG
jgi:hypothetical protein